MPELDNMCPPSPLGPRESSMAGQVGREVAPPETTLKWRYKEHWSGESASFDLGGIRAYVKDMDGDASYWTIRRGRHGPTIAEGENCTAYHWEVCLWEAEVSLRKIVADRIAELRSVSDENRNGSDPEGLRSAGLPARCHNVTDALTLSPKEQKGE